MNSNSAKSFVNPRARHGFKGRPCSIVAVGAYVPEKTVTNAELEKLVDTTDEWITTRTGIKERHMAAADEATSDLAAKAALRALDQGGIKAEDVDLIIVATVTPDMPFPSTACLVQRKIGATRAAAFDIEAACSGFLYALEVGQQFIQSQKFNTVLVVGAEKLTTLVDWTDRNTCVLFGDGAGAAVLQSRPNSHGLLATHMGADGTKASVLCVPGGGSAMPATVGSVEGRQHFIRMDGKETFKNAVQSMNAAATEVLGQCNLQIGQIKCVIPHQANRRIIDAVGERLGVAPGQVYVNLDRFGNTSAASVAIALAEAVETGRIVRGDFVLLMVFGAGFTWAAAIIEW